MQWFTTDLHAPSSLLWSRCMIISSSLLLHSKSLCIMDWMPSCVRHRASLMKHAVTCPKPEMWLYQTRHDHTVNMWWQSSNPLGKNTDQWVKTPLLLNSCGLSDSDWGRLGAGPQPGSSSWRSTGGCARLQVVKWMDSGPFHWNGFI